jgi:hypothetical protein
LRVGGVRLDDRVQSGQHSGEVTPLDVAQEVVNVAVLRLDGWLLLGEPALLVPGDVCGGLVH